MASYTETKPRTKENSKLRAFFIDQLQDIYWAEQKLVKTLPKLAGAAHSAELREAFMNHLEETKNHVTRVEQAFSMMGEKPEDKVCEALKGIAKEGEDIIDETDDNTSQRDVGLIFAGQKAEHYEIATYGGLVQLARTIHRGDVAELLGQTLNEEKKADELLTHIAEQGVNEQAAAESTDDED